MTVIIKTFVRSDVTVTNQKRYYMNFSIICMMGGKRSNIFFMHTSNYGAQFMCERGRVSLIYIFYF